MRSSNHLPRITRRAFATAAMLALLIGGAGIATAQSRKAQGEGELEAKNVELMTLQLEEVLIRVTDDTRIFDGDRKRIKFQAIPDPTKTPLTVAYSGSRSGQDEITAREVVVRETPQ